MFMRTRKNAGFTLIELLVVISIISLLSSIVLASLQSARKKGQIAAGLEFDASVYHAIGDNLIGQWLFDEAGGASATDTSANGHTGSISGAVYTTGVSNTGLVFNGTTDNVAIGNVSNSFPTTGTLSFWMYPTDVSSYRNPMSTNYGGGGGNAGIRFEETSAGSFYLVLGNDTGNYGSILHTFTNSLAPNNWYQVAIAWDTTANTVRGYLNGNRVFNDTHTFWPTSIPNMYLGVGFGGGRYFQGILDQVRLYSSSSF